MADKNSIENLDRIDLQLLSILQENSNLTTKELAERVNLSVTPVFERVKRLNNEGYIKKYVAVLDASKLHCDFIVYCQVKMLHINTSIAAAFADFVSTLPEVVECYNISGEFDYMMKICVPDMKEYRTFLVDRLGCFEHLGSIHSTFVMDPVKQVFSIPIRI